MTSVSDRDLNRGLCCAARALLEVVVDLAVERDPDRPVLVRHRLMAGRAQVDDAEPAMREHDASVGLWCSPASSGPRCVIVSRIRQAIARSSVGDDP